MNESKIRTLKRTQRYCKQQKIKEEQDQKDHFQDEKQKLEQEQEQAKRQCKRKKYHERATMNDSKSSTLKYTHRDQQQQKIKEEQDQKNQFQDEKQKLEEEQTKRECKQKKYHERATMNESKTSTLKCTQRDHQQQKIKQERDQNDQFQDEKQKPKQEQAKREFKQKKYHEREQEQKQREGPQMKNEPSHGAKQGKFQTIAEAVYSSESTSHYRKFSSQQGVTMQITETAQHRAYGRATLIRTHCSDPAHEARPTGTQHKYQNHATPARCRTEAPGIKHGSHRGIPHGKTPQIFRQEVQPPLITAMNPPIRTLFGLSAPVQNSLTPDAMQQSPIANFLRQSSQETGILMPYAQQPGLTLGQIGGNIQGVFQQMINESGNRARQ